MGIWERKASGDTKKLEEKTLKGDKIQRREEGGFRKQTLTMFQGMTLCQRKV